MEPDEIDETAGFERGDYPLKFSAEAIAAVPTSMTQAIDDETKRARASIRGALIALGNIARSDTPESRHRAVAVTKLEEALLWLSGGDVL